MEKKFFKLVTIIFILFLSLFVSNFSYGFVKDDFYKEKASEKITHPPVYVVDSAIYMSKTDKEIVEQLNTDKLGYNGSKPTEEMKFYTYIKIIKYHSKLNTYEIQFGETGYPIKYGLGVGGANQRFTIKELKEIFGLDENVKKSNLSVGYTWNANIIVGAQKGERAYNIWLKSLYTGADLNKIDEVQISEKTESNTVANVVSAITNFTSEWVEEFGEHPGGKIMETIMDPLGHVLGDGAQWLANLVQALPDDTYRDTLVLYTYKDLATDNKDGVDNTGIYGDGTTTKSSTKSTNQIVFIGDSRTVGLSEVNSSSSNIFQCKVSMGYDWMTSTAFPAVDGYAKSGTSFVILMGVNDLYNKDNYIKAINNKAKEWTSKGAQVFFASVGPVDNDPYATDSDITAFNSALKNGLSSDVTFIDLYAELKSNGYKTADGLHYTTETDKRILKFLEEQIKSGRNQYTYFKFV